MDRQIEAAQMNNAELLDRVDRLERELAELRAKGSASLPDGWVAVPARLTAENGAKSALIGEFHIGHPVTCMACESGGYADRDTCPECHGEGTVEDRVAVPWTMLKEIHGRVVDLFVRPTHPSDESEDRTDVE
jgi:hypothetical protein